MALFKPAFLNTYPFEEGYCDYPEDPGGATKDGITLNTLNDFRAKHNMPKADKDYLKALDVGVIENIYEQDYWLPVYNKIDCQPVANYIFDMSVNHGCGRSHRIVQAACNLPQDGAFGPKTLEAVNRYGQSLLKDLRKLRAQRYINRVAEKPDQKEFLDGWLNRAKKA